MVIKINKRDAKKIVALSIFITFFVMFICSVYGIPVGPTVSPVGNTTKTPEPGMKVNFTGNDTNYPEKSGGFIFTINLNSEQQNSRWKAYVGNVTGTLVLEDADGYSIYDWSITTSLTGEVYATRASGNIDWTNINCSYFNATHWENKALNHTKPYDNISATFNDTDNSEFYVGNVKIHENTCPTINLNINGSSDLLDDFEEVLLYDGGPTIPLDDNSNFGNIVYAAIVEEDQFGYNNQTYDFQMIVPEVGLDGWSSSTAYYFYVELG